tara:strand:- start:1973 stop:2566 length:594 start_codon:yes stop_codon:yes gene_type:complete
MDNEEKKSKWYFKYTYIAIGLVILYILLKNKYMHSKLLQLVDEEKMLKNYGIIGILIYILIGIVLNIVFFLYFFVNVVTGYIFGFKKGIPISMVIVTISSIISFVLSRYFLKENVKNDSSTFKTILDNQNDFNLFDWIKYNVITRISPIPFNIVNYFWGITEIDIWVYIFATIIGVIPWVIFEVYTGSIVKNINKYV